MIQHSPVPVTPAACHVAEVPVVDHRRDRRGCKGGPIDEPGECAVPVLEKRLHRQKCKTGTPERCRQLEDQRICGNDWSVGITWQGRLDSIREGENLCCFSADQSSFRGKSCAG